MRREAARSRPKAALPPAPTVRLLLQDIAEGIRVLQSRDGVDLSNEQILERARNIVTGLLGNYRTLALKSVMDGLATVAFAKVFGWGVLLSVIPVVAYQGTITLLAKLLEPYLRNPALLDSINATGGMLVFCIALIILELKKIELADYLPSLAFAPLITWLWR